MSRILVLLLFLVPVLSGCSTVGFYWQAARGHTDLMSRRVPIAEVLADPATDPAIRERLAEAVAIRRYASEVLALPDNDSYTRYADLERPYVTWNVFAAPAYSVAPRLWCFPVAGCVSYRGYFREEAARRESERLAAKGYDTFYGGAAAYSTLGRFEDPVLNTMVDGSTLDLAALLFHELAHQVVYRPGDAAFSESFASFVEREGVRRYFAARDDATTYAVYEAALARQGEFSSLVVAARESLAVLYAEHAGAEDLAARKAAEFDRLRAGYAELKSRWGGFAGFDRWFDRDLNNAHLVSVATYERLVPAFALLLAEYDGDLPAFYAGVQKLAREDDEVVEARLEALLAAAGR